MGERNEFRLRAFCRAQAVYDVARAHGRRRLFRACVIDAMEEIAAEQRASLESDLARLREIERAARETQENTELLLCYFNTDPESIDAMHAMVWSKHTLILANMRTRLRTALEKAGEVGR